MSLELQINSITEESIENNRPLDAIGRIRQSIWDLNDAVLEESDYDLRDKLMEVYGIIKKIFSSTRQLKIISKRLGVSTSTAYRLKRQAIELWGLMPEHTLQAKRALAIARLDRLYDSVYKKFNSSDDQKLGGLLLKIMKERNALQRLHADSKESLEDVFKKLQVPPYQISSDPNDAPYPDAGGVE